MIYIDFDGVILNTDPLLFYEWRKQPNHLTLSESTKIKYMQEQDWNYIINNSPVINDSIYYLQNMDPTSNSILTKVHSMIEAYEKTIWLRKNNIKLPIIIVPYYFKKTDIVNASGNTLIDDALCNLDDWKSFGGIPIFFDFDDDNYDTFQKENKQKYNKILSLSKIN